MVGGTGQYVWGLLEGWQVPQVNPNAKLREELESRVEAEGVGALYEELRRWTLRRRNGLTGAIRGGWCGRLRLRVRQDMDAPWGR